MGTSVTSKYPPNPDGDKKLQSEFLLAVYKDSSDQARLHETLRERVTTMVAATSGVLLGLLAVSGSSTFRILPVIFIVALLLMTIGAIGFALSWKHNERANFQRRRCRELRAILGDISGVKIDNILEDSDDSHFTQNRMGNYIKLHVIWLIFHAVIFSIGFFIISYTLIHTLQKCSW